MFPNRSALEELETNSGLQCSQPCQAARSILVRAGGPFSEAALSSQWARMGYVNKAAVHFLKPSGKATERNLLRNFTVAAG